jgi:hypothetical protein
MMADQPLLEVNCTNCPGNQACEDCLVRFFLAERDATVVPLPRRAAAVQAVTPAPFVPALPPVPAMPAARPSTRPPAEAPLPSDLTAVLALLQGAGMAPEVLAVEEHDAARAS